MNADKLFTDLLVRLASSSEANVSMLTVMMLTCVTDDDEAGESRFCLSKSSPNYRS